MSDNGKGSKRRPAAVSRETFLRNFENTFGPRPGERQSEDARHRDPVPQPPSGTTRPAE